MMMFKTNVAGYLHRKLIKAASIIILTNGPTLNVKINITGYPHPKIIQVANITPDAMTNFKHQKKKILVTVITATYPKPWVFLFFKK